MHEHNNEEEHAPLPPIKKTTRPVNPASFVVCGITGDLSKKKLIPALWNLYKKGNLPVTFYIIGFSDQHLDRGQYHDLLKQSLDSKNLIENPEEFEAFFEHCSYAQGEFHDVQAFVRLKDLIVENESKKGICGDKIFHLAVPPHLYEAIFQKLHESGLADMCGGAGGWTRILVEKPFGDDWNTAFELDKKLGGLFREEQIFRVDHYLGKESVENILAFRFSNSLFENTWNKDYVEKIHVRIWEDIGVEARGAFYDSVGALRDVGQNHILQMFALIAMERPGVFTADAVRAEREKVLNSLSAIKLQDLHEFAHRAQYQGFRGEPNVNPESQTETYFYLRAFVDNDRWQGVPFYLEGGKRMGTAKTEIKVYFRKKEEPLLPAEAGLNVQNVLTFNISPDEGISLSIFAEELGLATTLKEYKLAFEQHAPGQHFLEPDAYERVIYNCIVGDQTIFTSTKEVLASWEFITPILHNWLGNPLEEYPHGWKPLFE